MILAVRKAMAILSVLANAKGHSVPLMEIAAQTGYPKPTCAHILETLCHDGYAVRVSHSQGYTLGPALYCLTRYGRHEEELIALCRPVMCWMEKKSHATIILSVIQSRDKFIIDYADAEQNLLSEHVPIQKDDIYRTATGRAILAHSDRVTVEEIYQKYGVPKKSHWKKVTSFETLLMELIEIRKQDVVFSGLENDVIRHKNIGLACPIFQKRKCIGAIGIAWKPEEGQTEIPPQTKEMLCTVLKKGAREIQRRLANEERLK